MGKRENKRFEVILDEANGIASGSKILKDKKTGVLYYFHYSGYSGGMTVLVDKDGKPVIDTGEDGE